MSLPRDYFFLRKGFEHFHLDANKPEDAQFVFGESDRKMRDSMLRDLRQAAYATGSTKAVYYGDYGRGKTHLSKCVVYHLEQEAEPLFEPVYVKCKNLGRKSKFSDFFTGMVSGHDDQSLHQLAMKFTQGVEEGRYEGLDQKIASRDVEKALTVGLIVANEPFRAATRRYLGGQEKIGMPHVEGLGEKTLTDSMQYGDVLRGLSYMFKCVYDRVPVYVIDECERIREVTEPDMFSSWASCLRELTEMEEVSLFFMVGANNRDDLPVLLVEPEIIRRIGVSNYTNWRSPSKAMMQDYLVDKLHTTIRKGIVAEPHRKVLSARFGAEALDDQIPEELLKITGNDEDRLKCFPFEPDALEEFLVSLTETTDQANRVSEAQKRLTKLTSSIMDVGQRTISRATVEEQLSSDEGW